MRVGRREEKGLGRRIQDITGGKHTTHPFRVCLSDRDCGSPDVGCNWHDVVEASIGCWPVVFCSLRDEGKW